MSRIGMFTYSTQPRGSVVHAACLVEALSAQGHDVCLFALSKGGSGFFRDLACRVCLIPAGPAPEPMDQLIAQRIAEFVAGLTRIDPTLDLLHAQDCLAASALLEVRRDAELALSATPLVRTVHHVERFDSPYLAACQARSILEADRIFSVSELTEREVKEEFGRDSDRVQNGVDSVRFASLDRHRARLAARRELGLDPGAFIVVSVGGVEKRKNSVRCLEAMAGVVRSEPRARWVIVGGASVLDHRAYQERFEATLEQLGGAVRQQLQRPGTVSEAHLVSLYQASDVLLSPSEQEGWGLSVLEAMAAGLPVIVPRQAPFTEYVSEDSGAFVDPLDTEDIRRVVLSLARDPDWRERLGDSGQEVARRFSWRRSAARHAQLYRQILGPSAPQG
jgi:glycosyltransferase-like protein